MNDVAITCVVAVRNGKAVLERCLQSLIGQQSADMEIVICDGCSTDGTQDIIERYAKHIAYWRSAADKGIADAWNHAIERATGKWLLFLGADDRLNGSDSLFRAQKALSEQSAALIAYSDVLLECEDIRNGDRYGGPWNAEKFFRQGMYFSHQGVFHHREAFSKVGLFDITLKYTSDYDFIFRTARVADPIYLSSLKPIATMELAGISSQPSRSLAVLKEYQAVRSRYGVSSSGKAHFIVLKAMAKRSIVSIFGNDFAHKVLRLYRRINKLYK